MWGLRRTAGFMARGVPSPCVNARALVLLAESAARFFHIY